MLNNLLCSIIPVISMVIGLYAGYKLRGDGGKDNMPDIKSPKTIIKERKIKKKEKEELKEASEWLEKIDKYNGEFGK